MAVEAMTLTFSIPDSSKIGRGDVVTISYQASGVNAIKDVHSTPVSLADFTSTEVSNSSTQVSLLHHLMLQMQRRKLFLTVQRLL